MWFSSWLANRNPSRAGTHGRTPSAPRKRPTFRPQLEALDDRLVPSLVGSNSYSLPTGSAPQATVTADVNGDGNLDLITANTGSNSISVALGTGKKGAFNAPQYYAVGSYPTSVAVGDFNHDRKLDIVTANAGEGTVSVLLGKGNGTFNVAWAYAAGGDSVAVTDLNNDGKLDIVTDEVSVLLGNGDGTFGTAQLYAAGNCPVAVVVGDFNGDGKIDVVTANYNSGYGTISVLLGNGDGTLGTARSSALDPDYPPGALAVGDFNGDGKLDLVVASPHLVLHCSCATDDWGGAVTVLLGNGDGTFAPTGQFLHLAYWNPDSVAVADFNNDGKLDLVVGTRGSVAMFLGFGDGTFGLYSEQFLGSETFTSVVVGDFNGDGKPDVAVVGYDSTYGYSSVIVLLNDKHWN